RSLRRCATCKSSRSMRWSKPVRTRSSVMASSRRWFRADVDRRRDAPPVAPVQVSARVNIAVGQALGLHVPRASKAIIALSGGRDSVALFDAMLAEAPAHAIELIAVHVHHGLSGRADE